MQQSMVSSTYRAPASTASSARPFADNIFHASIFTSFPLLHVDTTIGFVCALPLFSTFFKERKGAAKVESCKNFLLLTMFYICLLYTSPSPRDRQKSRMPSS